MITGKPVVIKSGFEHKENDVICLMSQIFSSQVAKPTVEIFPACSGRVSLLLSHSGWEPATAELVTNNYKRIKSKQTVKIGALRLSLSKTN